MKPEASSHADDLREAEQLTVKLHGLIRSGNGDDDSADQLRERLLPPWTRLSKEHRKIVDDLSGDLYMLAGREHLDDGTVDDVLAIRDAWLRKDWIRILELCRLRLPKVDDHHRAYVRGRAYGELGLSLAAFSFLDHAAQLNPDSENYRYLAIEALLNAGEFEGAWTRARDLLANTDTQPTLLLKVADVMYAAAARSDAPFDGMLRERLIGVVDRALSGDAGSRVLKSVRVGGFIKKGYALVHLHRCADADAAFTQAIESDPQSDVALVARGLLRLDQREFEAAAADFEEAIRLDTDLGWPYLFLAKQRLSEGDNEQVVDFAERALSSARSGTMGAGLLELKGVALARMGHTVESLRALRDADALSPFNPRVARSIELLEQNMPAAELEATVDISPTEALRLAANE